MFWQNQHKPEHDKYEREKTKAVRKLKTKHNQKTKSDIEVPSTSISTDYASIAINFVIDGMLPFSLVESQAFRTYTNRK